ncbi:cilia- and flagella-associated protein 184 [Physeter macrocephalus]|uniref:Cilia- and flagella-associated protein 184 n=1 Tax=Physeter macrocephalus TaxID=9755 RepID=A0A2Y9EUF6_PHYMC|nr:coiled-coil domain-containing protein 96 [Physeter catodon]|eukprot:XP_007109314.1 coiled-coil domain-containing protein 96 [Physeter catodon]
MDDRSDHPGDPEKEDGDVESLASRLSGTKTSSGPQSPAEPAEPEPEAVEASEEGAEPAESQERPAATEVAGEKGPGEPEWPAEAEPGDLAEAGPEEPAKPEPEGGPEEPEKEVWELKEEWEDEEEAEVAPEPKRKEIPSQVSLQQAMAGKEEAAPDREAEREGQLAEEGEESEESEKQLVQGGLAKTEDELGDLDEGLELESCDWTEEVQKPQEQQLRAELLGQFRSLMAQRDRYQRYSIDLQHRIFEALRKKGLDAAEAPEKGLDAAEAPDKEQAYLRHLAMLEDLRKQESDDLRWYHRELDQLKQQCKEKLSRVEKEWRRLQALKKQVVMQAMGSCRMRGGRQAALREVEQIQALEDKKEKEISAVRLENVQLKQSLVHFENRMRAQEDLTEGLLLIDFEQLKIENQTFNEKVEERNEELLKLHSKVTNNVQIITHVKEKLHFVDRENARKKSELMEIEAQVALKRNILTKTKQARDSLRIDNIKLNQKCGLLGKEALLWDMEEKVDRTEELSQRLEALKHHHAGLILSCRGVKQKIREAKAFLPS